MKVAKENNFSLIHLLGACMVVFGHMYALAAEGAPRVLGVPVHIMGVYILFVVSGYLVTGSYMRTPKLSVYYLKRLLRIYPPLAVCLLLTAVGMWRVSAATFSDYVEGALLYIRCNLLMKPYYGLPGAFHENPYPYAVNGSLWTLPVELMCFFVLPAYVFAMRCAGKRAYKLSFFISVLLALVLIAVRAQPASIHLVVWGTDWVDALRVIVCFFMGMSYGLMEERQLRRLCRTEWAVFVLVLALCMGSDLPQWAVWFLLPYLVMSFGLERKGVLRAFCSRNDYAYGIFLWGFPIQQLVMYAYIHLHLPVELSPVVLFAVSFPMVWVMGYMQARFVEEPVGRLVKRL